MIDAHNCQKVKALIDFDKNNCNSIGSLAVENVKVTLEWE